MIVLDIHNLHAGGVHIHTFSIHALCYYGTTNIQQKYMRKLGLLKQLFCLS